MLPAVVPLALELPELPDIEPAPVSELPDAAPLVLPDIAPVLVPPLVPPPAADESLPMLVSAPEPVPVPLLLEVPAPESAP